MNSQEIPFRFFLKSKQMFNQNFQTDEDHDDTTGDLAYFPSFPPILFPRKTAMKLMRNVVIPIRQTAERISTFRNAKLIPTANASILVAIASKKISFAGMDSMEVSHSLSALISGSY